MPLGSITPRLWTRPLRKLTPDTSYGFRVIWFAANILHEPLDPWQQWVAIHLGELMPDGTPRFRKVLILVARQNGKTHLCKVLALYWLYVERQSLVFGTSTNLDQAKESWEAAVATAQTVPSLAGKTLRPRIANGQQTLPTRDRCRYKIGAADRKGGRGKTIKRAIGDELREQLTWEAYRALKFATNAVADAQIVYITNQGDAKSVVLKALRDAAIAGTDPELGLFEWSAPPGTHPLDVNGWAAANPALGRRMAAAALAGDAARVAAPGADPEDRAGFLTEALCMEVDRLDPALDPIGWQECHIVGTLEDVRLAACVDVAPNGMHATLAAAAVVDGVKVRVETVAEWSGPTAVADMERDLPMWIGRVKPAVLGWFPTGPAAAAAARLADRRKAGRYGWPPPGVTISEVRSEMTAVCMALAKEVAARTLLHSGQAMLDAQVDGAEKLPRGDGWVISRKGGPADAVYAIAGAAHLARTMPGGLGKVRVVLPSK